MAHPRRGFPSGQRFTDPATGTRRDRAGIYGDGSRPGSVSDPGWHRNQLLRHLRVADAQENALGKLAHLLGVSQKTPFSESANSLALEAVFDPSPARIKLRAIGGTVFPLSPRQPCWIISPSLAASRSAGVRSRFLPHIDSRAREAGRLHCGPIGADTAVEGVDNKSPRSPSVRHRRPRLSDRCPRPSGS